MTLQSSGAISLLDIQNEFGGSAPIGINEYYGAGGAPSSGTISIGNFYGRSAAPVGSMSVTALLMAGGGSAESDEEDPRPPGGGGGGGLLTEIVTVAGSIAVTVGASDGNTSFASPTIALAGGYTFSGGESTGFSGSGGSGGGASSGGRGGSPAGSGTPGQGNPGGNGYLGGGGGGKGSAGSGPPAGVSVAPGGSGYNIADFRGGPSLTVAFGGPGYQAVTGPDISPAANTGGGATAGSAEGGTVPGGSGIVIIRYPGSTALATGGNSTYTRTVGGTAYYFHEFTTSGTFTKT